MDASKPRPLTTRILRLALLAACLGLSACGSASSADGAKSEDGHPKGYVSRATLGADWPLTTNDGVLACEGSGGVGSATITTDGTKYALNGIAKGRKDGADIDPVWAADDSGLGLKKNIGPLIDAALKLCA